MGACSPTASPSATDRATSSSACAPVFTWDISRDWRLIALDDLVEVPRGGTLKVRAKPYEPRTASVSVEGDGRTPSVSEVLQALRERTGTPLAAPGATTSGLTRTADIQFHAKGAAAVTYQGVRTVTGTFRYRCTTADASAGRGEFTTWDPGSLAVGLVDCRALPRDNPRGEPAELALTKRCPTGSPARRQP